MLAFMQIIDSGGKAIPGEATALGYTGWCVVDGVDYEVSGDDGDNQSGDDDVFTLRVGKLVDSATHRIMQCALMQAGSSNAHFQSVIVEVVGVNQKPSSAQLRTVIKIVMTDVWVTDWKIQGESSWSGVSEQGVPTESVDFRFSKVSFVYSDLVYDSSAATKSKGAYVFEADASTLSARSWFKK